MPAERKVRSDCGNRWSQEAARRSALFGIDGRNGDAICNAVPQSDHRLGHQHARTARIVVNVKAILPLIGGAIASITVVMVTIVRVIMAIMLVPMMMVMAMMCVVFIANGMGMNQ